MYLCQEEQKKPPDSLGSLCLSRMGTGRGGKSERHLLGGVLIQAFVEEALELKKDGGIVWSAICTPPSVTTAVVRVYRKPDSSRSCVLWAFLLGHGSHSVLTQWGSWRAGRRGLREAVSVLVTDLANQLATLPQ